MGHTKATPQRRRESIESLHWLGFIRLPGDEPAMPMTAQGRDDAGTSAEPSTTAEVARILRRDSRSRRRNQQPRALLCATKGPLPVRLHAFTSSATINHRRRTGRCHPAIQRTGRAPIRQPRPFKTYCLMACMRMESYFRSGRANAVRSSSFKLRRAALTLVPDVSPIADASSAE